MSCNGWHKKIYDSLASEVTRMIKNSGVYQCWSTILVNAWYHQSTSVNGINESTVNIKNCDIHTHINIWWVVKVRESLCTQVIVWGNSILKHIDTRATSPSHKGSCMTCRHE